MGSRPWSGISGVLSSFSIVSNLHFSSLSLAFVCLLASYTLSSVLEHGIPEHRSRAISLIGANLAAYATDSQASKSIDKALKSCQEEAMEVFVTSLCDPGKT